MGDKVKIIDSLHPQQVCSLLAVINGVKPSTIVESVEVNMWRSFLSLVKSEGLAIAYKAYRGYAILTPKRECFLIPHGRWRIFLKQPDLSLGHRCEIELVKPVSESGLDIGGVYVSRDLDTLFELIRLSESSVKDGDIVRRLGVVLGYPKCCIDKYIEEGALKAWHRYLYSLIKEKMDKGVPPELWAIYHAPCSPKCKKIVKARA